MRSDEAQAERLHLVACALGAPRQDDTGGRQRVGFVLLAKGRNLLGILLQAIVVQNIIVRCGAVIAAQEKSDEIPVRRAVSQPITASDLVHVQLDLSRGGC